VPRGKIIIQVGPAAYHEVPATTKEKIFENDKAAL
jgi:hypothetical protein